MMNEEDLLGRLEMFFDKIKKCYKYVAEPYLAKEGLRMHHLVFLGIINLNPGISQKEIKTLVPYDKSRVSMVITELLDLGLVENQSFGKVSSLVLTDKGCTIYDKTKKATVEFRESMFKDLSEDEFDTFLLCMNKFDNRLDEILNEHSESDKTGL